VLDGFVLNRPEMVLRLDTCDLWIAVGFAATLSNLSGAALNALFTTGDLRTQG
jgi:hypothetical protein